MRPPVDDPQRRLYALNHRVLDAEGYAELLDLERGWVVPAAAREVAQAPPFESLPELMTALRDLLEFEEREGPSEHERFLAQEASLEQFKMVVADFAVDGLVESQSHLGIIPRLPGQARNTVMRVLIDEFGCGNNDQEHAELYRRLVAGLGMPTELAHYVAEAPAECLAYVNVFHWFAHRAPEPEYFLGAYAYFESSVLYAFRCYADAGARLGIDSTYYTEHLHIDSFHSTQMRSAIYALQRERPVELAKVWAGVQLTSRIVAEATEASFGRARQRVPA
ncbi:iron-containing redox enzyme family protein [Actinoalloteichus hymeniacidonis]|uniref:Iron-containing redox enzyme n=1 Tax=Actinoalloteichus hymeniacidonis TaxID=340345 RepID=A0AAC9HT39_9PSEU|nr:iron-containing redox enzyme family protein [Actinoalloteichus hymeniacidonis]AOS64616.1 Iron-containing redox enzyme [Actinoalloteichus hymeniacidonis]MBB5907311.1 hypothetical protein [Actinoalloteichus hymeniacidonis]